VDAKSHIVSLAPDVDPNPNFEVGRDNLNDSDYVEEDAVSDDDQIVVKKPTIRKSRKAKEKTPVTAKGTTEVRSQLNRKRPRSGANGQSSFLRSTADGERTSQRRKVVPTGLKDYQVQIQ
jgi:hypothetical protein